MNKIFKKIGFLLILICFVFIFANTKSNVAAKIIDIHELIQNAEYTDYDEEASIVFFTPGANSRSDYFGWDSKILEGTFVDVFNKSGFTSYKLTYEQDIDSFSFQTNKKYVIALNNSDVAYLGHDIYNNPESNQYAGSYKALEKLVEKVIFKYMTDIYGNDLNDYKIPRIIMVGHSRGGINDMLFAVKHPLLVDKLFSVGTPYNGSSLYYNLLEQGFDIMTFFDDLILSQCVDRTINDKLKEEWNNYKNNKDYYYHAELYTISGLTSYGNLMDTLYNFINVREFNFVEQFFVDFLFKILLGRQKEIENEDGTYKVLYRFNGLIEYIEKLYNSYKPYIGEMQIGDIKVQDIITFVKYVLSLLNNMKKEGKNIYYNESDFFVDDLSQSADGFIVDYNYKKIFTNTNSNYAYHLYDSYPAIVHALEPMDSDVINYVLTKITK